jgi:peptidyl-prolyl cis-trans isomerase D
VARVPATGANGALANRNFLTALFAPESLERKHNTEAVEIGSNQLAVGRVVQYSPARVVPLAEVKEQVRGQLVAERAAALAKAEGEAKLAAWKTNAAGAPFGAPVTVSRLETQSQSQAVIDSALRLDASKLPTLTGVDLGKEGYVVVRTVKSVPRTAPSAEVAKQEAEQVTQAISTAENAAYYELLKQRFKAEILVPTPADAM